LLSDFQNNPAKCIIEDIHLRNRHQVQLLREPITPTPDLFAFFWLRSSESTESARRWSRECQVIIARSIEDSMADSQPDYMPFQQLLF
jgi:hypothetical protein